MCRARDGVNIGSASVPATTQLGGNYKSSTLTPGEKYTFKITATNGRLGATGSAGSVNRWGWRVAWLLPRVAAVLPHGLLPSSMMDRAEPAGAACTACSPAYQAAGKPTPVPL